MAAPSFRNAAWLVAATALAAATSLVAARPRPHPVPFPDYPPLAHTGGFGEPTCVQCHTGAPLDTPGGTLALDGLPEGYQPGLTYRFTVLLRRSDMQRAGFELAARFASGGEAGRQAGKLVAPDARTQVHDSLGVQYASHTRAGSDLLAEGLARWAMAWTAPMEAGGPVVFHLVGNAANDDASPLGDFIYATSRRVDPAGR